MPAPEHQTPQLNGKFSKYLNNPPVIASFTRWPENSKDIGTLTLTYDHQLFKDLAS